MSQNTRIPARRVTSRDTEGPARRVPRSLNREYLVSAVAVPLVLLFALGISSYLAARSVIVTEKLESLQAVASVQEGRVEAFIDRGVSTLAQITSRTRMRDALDEYLETGDDQLLAEVEGILGDSLDASLEVISISLLSNALHPFVSVGAPDDLPDVAELEFDMSDGPVVGTVVSTPSGEAVHLIAGPVVIDDVTLGIAVITQSMASLHDLVMDYSGLGETGETILAQRSIDDVQFLAPLRFDPDATLNRAVGAVATLPMTHALAGEESRFEGIDYRGEPVFSFTRHISDTGWGLVVKEDTAAVLGPLNTYALPVGMALTVALLLIYGASTRSVSRLVRPIEQLAKAAQGARSGNRDFDVESDVVEVAELADSVRSMFADIDQLTSGLEATVEERTLELAEKNTQLERLMGEREVFVAGVSHELRSPLTAMIGFIDIIQQSGDTLESEDRNEMLETVADQAVDVLNLVEDLLAAARVEAGTLKVAEVSVNMAAQARQVIEATPTSIRATVDFAGGDGVAVGDPSRVRQIIRNLVSNALRYGGSSIEIGVVVTDDTAVLEVRDDGVEIPPEEQAKVFEAYGQSDATRTVAESVGLGLYVSRELARLMGGDLTYDHTGVQSVFSLALPLEDPESTDSTSEEDVAHVLSGRS